MLKIFFKLMLCVIVYAAAFMAANALMPFSRGFRELGVSENSMGMLFMLINAAWVCFTIFFIIRNSHWSGVKLFLVILFVMFFIQSFMMQVETLFFADAFFVITKTDIMLIMFAGLFPLLAATPLLIKFFQNRDVAAETTKIDIKSAAIKLGVIGIVYLCVYMVFGYFVAWQFEDLRLFYSGSPEKLNFFGQLVNNMKTNPAIYPFQILRGILFGIFVLPLQNMIGKKSAFIISVCLVFLCTAAMLIIPNVLFPDTVRFAHLIEMTSSMLLFGIISGKILWGSVTKK